MKKIVKDIFSMFTSSRKLKILDVKVEEGPELFFYLVSQLDVSPMKVSSYDLLTKFQHAIDPDDLLRAQNMHERLVKKLNQYVIYEIDFERKTITLIRSLDSHQATVKIEEVLHSKFWKEKINPNVLSEILSKNSFRLGSNLWEGRTAEKEKAIPKLVLVKR